MSSKLTEVLERDAVNAKWNNAIVKQIEVTRPIQCISKNGRVKFISRQKGK